MLNFIKYTIWVILYFAFFGLIGYVIGIGTHNERLLMSIGLLAGVVIAVKCK